MEISLNNIYNTDCIDLMGKMASGSVDLIVTDPPYGIDFSHNHETYNRNPENVLEGYQEVDPAAYLSFTEKWISETHRVLKDEGTIYIVSGFTHLRHILNVLHEVDLGLVNSLVWRYNFGVYAKKNGSTVITTSLWLPKTLRK